MESILYLLLYPLSRLWEAFRALRAHWPTDRRMVALIHSPRARAARAAERERIRELVDALGAVEGVEHVLTQVRDFSVRPDGLAVLHSLSDADALLLCRISARAYFVVREDITDVLPRIEAADVAEWCARDQRPSAGGTVEHALRWYRNGGINQEGLPMDSPDLFSPVARLNWDRSGILRPDPEPNGPYISRRFRTDRTPADADGAQLLREARAGGQGVVLELVLGANGHDHRQYHVVPRGGFAGRGRLI
ncbi:MULTISPECIES: hypothetical protein [unclassified Kitasatospora]|uniref:hypothetical protein n=1 Tax=unclassified Kitasatospora TaxID=2633591 RepID=UPI00340B734D